MQPLPEIDELRGQIQLRHREHLEIELRLGCTFVEVAMAEQDMGERTNASRTLDHAREAVAGARGGLLRIANLTPGERHEFLARIGDLEKSIGDAMSRKQPYDV